MFARIYGKPCHIGVHWIALVKYSQMCTQILTSFGNSQISNQQDKQRFRLDFLNTGHQDQ